MSPQPSTQIAPTLRARLPYYPGYTDTPNYQPPTIIPEGDGSNGIWLVGEASGENEARDGLPFRPYAPAGSVLERAMREIGLARQECTISNMVWYQPPRNWLEHAPYEQAAVEVCRPLNDHLFSLRKPKVIVALGNVAFRYLTGIRAPKWIPSRQKKSWTLSAMRGWAFHSDDPVLGCHFGDGRVRQGDCWYEGVPVVPTYHPSFLRRGSKEADEQVGGGAKVSAAGGGTGGGMGLLGVLKDDLKRAWAIAQGRAQKMHWRIYEDCRPQDMQKVIDRCLADPTLLVSYDFETAESVEGSEDEVEQFGVPTQFQVALDEKEAYVWLWTPELLPYLKRLLELPNPKLDWNGRGFDRQLIRRLGIRVDQGIWHDGMDLWGFWQPDLPRGLQYAASFTNELDSAWKHTFPIVPQVYGGLDVLWPQRLWDKLKVWMGQVRSRQSGIDVWSAYRDQVVRLAPGLDEMEEIGIPISETKRLEVKERLHKMAEEEFLKIQSMVPQEVRKLEPKNGYANDKIAEKVKASGKLELGEEWITRPVLVEVKEKKVKKVSKKKIKEQLDLSLIVADVAHDTKTVTLDTQPPPPEWQTVARQFRLQPFLVTSPQQLKDYINWKRQEEITARVARGQGHKDAERLAKYVVPVDWKTRKETTSKKELEKLFEKTGDPLFKSAILYREIRKMDGTYVGDRDEDEETGEVTNVTGWAPQADGRVHPHFGFGTGIGQLTAKNPNSMNMTRHNKVFGDMLREMVEAPDGYVWVTADMKSFHVLTLGFEADDPNYMRLARLDMHSFFAAVGLLKLYKPEHLLDLPDQELMAKLKWHREKDTRDYGGKSFGVIRDTRAKRGILGYGNGLSGMGMWRNNPDDFNSKQDADSVIDALDHLFPKECAYRKAQAKEADQVGMLVSRYGFNRRFNAVFEKRQLKWNERPKNNAETVVDSRGNVYQITHGNDYEAAISFRHMNDAFGMIRAQMIQLRESGLSRKYGLCNNEHDALKFCCSQVYKDECIDVVRRVMQAPSSVLRSATVPDGLWCEVEMGVGKNWAKMEKLK